jgi:hypothetical protein
MSFRLGIEREGVSVDDGVAGSSVGFKIKVDGTLAVLVGLFVIGDMFPPEQAAIRIRKIMTLKYLE